jgi:hypothetical protein
MCVFFNLRFANKPIETFKKRNQGKCFKFIESSKSRAHIFEWSQSHGFKCKQNRVETLACTAWHRLNEQLRKTNVATQIGF